MKAMSFFKGGSDLRLPKGAPRQSPLRGVLRRWTNGEGEFDFEPIEGGTKYVLVFGDLRTNVQEVQLQPGEVKTVTLKKR